MNIDFIKKFESLPIRSSYDRYKKRQAAFVADNKSLPLIRHHFYWMLHNCVVHPLLGIFPTRKTYVLHELTSRWLNKHINHWYHYSLFDLEYSGSIKTPRIENKWLWIKHNVGSHMLIGFFPCVKSFKFHDKTAKEMNVPGWV